MDVAGKYRQDRESSLEEKYSAIYREPEKYKETSDWNIKSFVPSAKITTSLDKYTNMEYDYSYNEYTGQDYQYCYQGTFDNKNFSAYINYEPTKNTEGISLGLKLGRMGLNYLFNSL